jgi:type IV pilus assembly protein PilB
MTTPPVAGSDTVALPKSIAEQAKALGVPLLENVPATLSKEVLLLIPEDSARKYGMVAYQKTGDTLLVAMLNPQDFEALNVLRFLAEKERLGIEVSLVGEKVFNEILKSYTGADMALKEAILSLKKEDENIAQKEELALKKKSGDADIFQDAPIAKLVEVIVKHAIDGRASDIHIEPIDSSYRVRFRVDGLLRADLVFPREVG